MKKRQQPSIHNACATMFLSAVCCSSTLFAEESRLLSEAEMSAVIGGLEITSFPTPSNNTTFHTDNVPLELSVRYPAIFANGNQVIVEAFVGGTKADALIVTSTLNGSNLEGTLQQRMKWPLGVGSSTLEMKYCNPNTSGSLLCGTPPFGPNTKTNLLLPSDVSVINVHFYNTDDGNDLTSVTVAEVIDLVDNRSFDYNHASTASIDATDSSDAILAQCATPDRVQFRYAGPALSLPTVQTLTTRIELSRFNIPSWDDILWIDSGFESEADDNDPNEEDFHVFFIADGQFVDYVDSNGDPLELHFDGATRGANSPGGRHNKIIISVSELDTFRTATVLAHEIGHAMADREHEEDEPDGSVCSDTFTVNEVILSGKNVMCETRFAGRALRQAQCNDYHANMPLGVLDRNP